MIQGNIDAHCHLFNVEYALRELLDIGWRWIHGNYPYKSRERDAKMLVEKKFPEELRELIDYVASLLRVAFSSPEENYEYEQKCYTNSPMGQEVALATVPLMMDIYFILDDGSSLQQKSVQTARADARSMRAMEVSVIMPEEAEEFNLFVGDMKHRLLNAVRGRTDKALPRLDAEAELDRVINAFKHELTQKREVDERTPVSLVQKTWGFRQELRSIKSLQKKHQESVFPFLAVDPRRIGIEQLVRDEVVNGSLRGVKLYCPLGYLPSHPALFPVYRLCVEHGIPVTSHTSPGGLPSACKHIDSLKRTSVGDVVSVVFDKEEYINTHPVSDGEYAQRLFFADPDNWLDVFDSEGFEQLRVNLAHFGGQEDIVAFADGKADENNWTAKIVRLIERYDNVYSDIAYCPDPDVLSAVNTIIGNHPKVGERLMFGTDFVMLALDHCGLEQYFSEYCSLEREYLTTNPNAFLRRDS